jgi:HK97 gp10 family phage protein
MAQDGVTVSLPGARDLIAELKEFKEDVARRMVRKVLRDIGEFMLTRLRANAPIRTGKLRLNLDVVTRWKSRSGVMQAKVIVRTQGKAGDPRNAFYWRFVEYGWRLRRRFSREESLRQNAWKITGRDRGGGGGDTVAGQKFIERTMRETQRPIENMFFHALEAAINKRKSRTR